MYAEHMQEVVEFVEAMKLCVNDWADACFGHWFTMYLYTIGTSENLNETAYFHPRFIKGGIFSDDLGFVIDHMKDVISFHKDKAWFIASHLIREHCVLLLLHHHPVYKTWKSYIFYTNRLTNEPSDYEITAVFAKAIEQKITWEMANCRRQPHAWECGCLVMMAMYDFVIIDREILLPDKTKMVRQAEINEFVQRMLKAFISSFGDYKDSDSDDE